jgi:hypothetical protein
VSRVVGLPLLQVLNSACGMAAKSKLSVFAAF